MDHHAPNIVPEGSLIPARAERGRSGERCAAAFLRRSKGFQIVARNWRNPYDHREEIDLVAVDREILVFVEVRTRASGSRVPGFFTVGAHKKNVLRRVTRTYLRLLRERPRTYRFDVVEVQWGPGGPAVHHFENIPLFRRFE